MGLLLDLTLTVAVSRGGNERVTGKVESTTQYLKANGKILIRGKAVVDSKLRVTCNGARACSMFRMWQGWLSMSSTGPGEGTLLVNPLFKLATVYYLLRPFFEPRVGNREASGYLDESNWGLAEEQSSVLQGATMGCTQELNDALHPHLELENTMTHIPDVRPGDYLAWHCDSIHAVDKVHAGKGDSSVMYIPACPLSEVNTRY